MIKVSVIIPTYKRPEYLPLAVQSILDQEDAPDFEIIVASDGDNGAASIASDLRVDDYYIESDKNEGQSATLNEAMARCSGEYIVVQHDDDIALPHKLATLAAALDANPKAGIACALSGCINADGSINAEHNDKRIERYRARGLAGPDLVNQRELSYIDGAATMYRRSMIDDLDGWDESLPHGEEVDIHVRACMRGWEVAFVDNVVAQYRVHGGNKSLEADGRLKPKAYEVGRTIREGFRDLITVNISSIVSRRAGLKRAVSDLLPQCDHMNVYLSGYDDIPGWLLHGKIAPILGDPETDRGSIEKFRWALDTHGYYLTCDDDIFYPPDYVKTLVLGIEKYKRGAIVGFHGSVLTKWPVDNYYKDRTCYHFKRALDEDTPVHVIGNVCAGFHTDTVPALLSTLESEHTQDDVLLSCVAEHHGVQRVCLAHPDGWIQPNPAIDQADSIFEQYRNGNDAVNRDINHTEWTLGEVPA